MKSKVHKYYADWNQGVIAARAWLNNQGSKTKFLFEQNRNLGDTLHLTPIIRHYRNLHPDAAMAFIIAKPYQNAHEFNPHIDRLFLVPKLDPNPRINLRRQIISFNEIDYVIAPSIFPYGAVWKKLNWSHPNIADQYFANAGITEKKNHRYILNGGRKLLVNILPEDQKWADTFLKTRKLNPDKVCLMEFNSYSAPPKWKKHNQFKKFVVQMRKNGFNCISICGKNETPVQGSINAAGITWRQTVALANQVKYFIGVGSGLTMLAAAAENPPRIFEIGIPASVSMEGCQYCNTSENLTNIDPIQIANYISK